MKKSWTLKKVIILLIVTNLITASVLIFVPLPFIGGKKLVSGNDYNFLQNFNKMEAIKGILDQKYVNYIDNKGINESKMIDPSIKGMVESLGDPYTVYMDKKEYDELKTTTEGSYAGIGIYVGEQDNKILVIAPIEDSPAAKAGIKAGDVIMKVDGQSVTAKDTDKAVALMKGKINTKVTLTIQRANVGVMNIQVTRATIVLKTVKGEMLDNSIGYIRITTFDQNTANEFDSALKDLQGKGMKGLIIDLRDNPGGLLDVCAKIADRILGKGTIVYTIDKQGKKESLESDASKLNVPLAVLVNGNSASASEILSGAIRDFKAGTLVGTKTFGKGIVQEILPFNDGTALKVTTARYYTPSGECIQGKGITPNVVIDLPESIKGTNFTRAQDVQLQKAIEVVKLKL